MCISRCSIQTLYIWAHPDPPVCQTGVNLVYLGECDLLKLWAVCVSFTSLLQNMAYRAGLAQKAIFSHRLKRESLHSRLNRVTHKLFSHFFFSLCKSATSAASYFQSVSFSVYVMRRDRLHLSLCEKCLGELVLWVHTCVLLHSLFSHSLNVC